MKKIISLVLILTLSVFAFAACGGKDNKDDENTPVEKNYSLAIGVATTQSGAKVTNTVAALVIGEDGKIVSCRIDCIDVSATLLDDGTVDASKTYKSKAELGDTYDSYSPMPAGRWYQQAQAFETYVTGKTQAEVTGIALEAGKTTLIAGCTIAVSDFVKAVDNAFKSAHKISFKTASEIKVGVAVNADVAPATKNDAVLAKYTADFAATVTVDGKIVASVIDSNEVNSTITGTEFGAIVNPGTKLEQGDTYDSYSPMPAGRWYQQVEAFAATAVGKTAAEVAGLATEGVAGCSIYAGGYKAALEKAAANVR
ncbi:MAG: hypothetical protein IJW53_02195 [Clostridia bacterium]|nr:hypothetical protein [Clostridia bacterium]